MVSLKSASLGSVGNTPCARETDTAPTRVATLAARASVSKPAAMRTRKSADVISIPCGAAHDGWVQGHATGVVGSRALLCINVWTNGDEQDHHVLSLSTLVLRDVRAGFKTL